MKIIGPTYNPSYGLLPAACLRDPEDLPMNTGPCGKTAGRGKRCDKPGDLGTGGNCKHALIILGIAMFSSVSFAVDTDLLYYRPFTKSDKQPTLSSIDTMSGECNEQSKRIKREDAWRCRAGEKIYDPCFLNPNGNQQEVLCIAVPWSSQAVQLTLAKELNTNYQESLDMSRTMPWALQLKNGNICQAIDPGQVFDNTPVRYRCKKDTVLFGYVQRCSSEWTILQKSKKNVSTVEISKAWF